MQLGRFHLDLRNQRLYHGSELASLGERAIEILCAIVVANGRLITRHELLRAVWPNTIVEDNNLNVHVTKIRKALGHDGKLIITVHGKGYRLAKDETVLERLAIEATPIRGSAEPDSICLVGRGTALMHLRRLLDNSSMLTLTGIGGVGKTRLASELLRGAESNVDVETTYVNLAALADHDEVLRAVTDACNISIPDGPRIALKVAKALAGKRRILLLDGVEHLLSVVAVIVEILLSGNRSLQILVTSRVPLNIQGEILFRVEPLDVPTMDSTEAQILNCSSVELFIKCAQARHLTVGSNSREVYLMGEICRRLDGIPFAIELSVGRVAALGVESVHSHLKDRFSLLSDGYRTSASRHRSLQAMYDECWRLIGSGAQCLLQRLAIFESDFCLREMYDAVCDIRLLQTAATDALCELIAHSLVNADLSGSIPKYSLLESTRVYAMQQSAACRMPKSKVRARPTLIRTAELRHTVSEGAAFECHDPRSMAPMQTETLAHCVQKSRINPLPG